MSLLGVVSRIPVLARMVGPKEDWGFVVHDGARRWSVSACGTGGVLAWRRARGGWMIRAKDLPPSPLQATATAELVVAAATPPTENLYFTRSSEWFFAHEGTIGDVGALCAALDPDWFVRGGYPREPGALIFEHMMSRVAEADSTSADEAMAKAGADLRRARALGSVAILCSNGIKLYAYVSGHRLSFSNVADAILVASSEILSVRPNQRELPDGALVVLTSHPQLGWAMLGEPLSEQNIESFAMKQARRGFR